ncbi:MAG TPA: outer membrane protein transport protein [Vicinamibacterales bacterium]|jgi:long-subunit fatty acid transport protein
MLTRRASTAAVFAGAIALVLLATAKDAAAQATAQFPVQFDFQTPGARSMAMGGAFVGAADDATAAFTNPAGLSSFGTKQFSIEGRFKSVDTPYLAGGRVSGQPTGIGVDTVPNPVFATDTDNHFGAGFIAIVLPVGAHTSVTAYRHELVNVDNEFFSSGVFQRASFFGGVDDRNRDTPLGGTRAIAIANYGASIGHSWKDDRIAIGGGLAFSHFNIESHFARFAFATDIFGAVNTNVKSATADQTGDDIGFSPNVGALWRPRENVSLGATYRRGASFTFTQQDRVFAADIDVTRTGKFKVPDVYGVGFAWTATERLRVLVDYDRVQYSQLKTDFIDFQAISSGRPDRLTIDDGNEVHGGVEFRTSMGGHTVALRGGAWFDPDHTVRYEPTAANDSIDVLLAATLPGGPNLMHYTFGGGIALPKRMVLDAAADFSSRTRYATASLLIRF